MLRQDLQTKKIKIFKPVSKRSSTVLFWSLSPIFILNKNFFRELKDFQVDLETIISNNAIKNKFSGRKFQSEFLYIFS